MLRTLRAVYERLTEDGSTEEQAVRSGIWVAGINVGDRVLQLLKIVILARLLSPAAFGLLGIALVVMSALRRFSSLGLGEALIQHEDANVDQYLNTAWMIQVIRGILVAIVAYFAAPSLAGFFNEPQATGLIRVITIANLGIALQNPATVYFQKELNFHKEFVYQLGSRVLDIGAAVAIAVVFRSVWALAAGIVAMNLSKFVLSYVIHSYRPALEFDVAYAKEMLDFGKWLLIHSILLFLLFEADDAFVGWFFTASALGFYQVAYRYSNAPATEITAVISRVAFPAFSKVQDDTKKLREGFFRTLKLSTTISLPLAGGILAVAPQFVYSVLGNQWGPMIPLMQVLAVWGGVRACTANTGAIFKTVGRPDFDVYLLGTRIAILALAIVPAAETFGIVGVAYVLLGQSLVTRPIEIYITLSVVEGTAARYVRHILYPALGSIGMVAAVVSFDEYIFTGFGVIRLFLLVVLGVVIYVSIMITLEEATSCEFTSLYQNIVQSL